ncbi:MAG TPA: 7-carboxy-7-deazaguanine synthase QueE [Candidatus Methanoperedens sp.]
MHAYIDEVFNSVQGEGPYVGVRQVFVRFGNCQLHCSYCDTPESRDIPGICRIEKTPGTGRFSTVKNPLAGHDLEEMIHQLSTPSTRHISLTGGEPLIYADFIKTLNLEYPVYLETNSGFPDRARKLQDMVAIASCDIKLPEHNSTDHYGDLLENELKTISIFNETSKTFVKIVILPETSCESLSPAIDGIASIDRSIPLILQPVTLEGTVFTGQLLRFMDLAGEKLKDVRAIPQTHKMMGFF